MYLQVLEAQFLRTHVAKARTKHVLTCNNVPQVRDASSRPRRQYL